MSRLDATLAAALKNEWFKSSTSKKQLLQDVKPVEAYYSLAEQYGFESILEPYLKWLLSRFQTFGLNSGHLEAFLWSTIGNYDISHLEPDAPPSTHSAYETSIHAYIKALSKHRAKDASHIIDQLKHAISLQELYQEFFQPMLYEVGYLWEKGRLSVALEHYITAFTQYEMSKFYKEIFATENTKGNILTAAIGDEAHEIGIRMIADMFESTGYDTVFLGSDLPVEEIISHAENDPPDLFAFSITMTPHLTSLTRLISNIKTKDTLKDIPVLVGGRPFNHDPALYEKIGAAASANTLDEAVEKGGELIGQ